MKFFHILCYRQVIIFIASVISWTKKNRKTQENKYIKILLKSKDLSDICHFPHEIVCLQAQLYLMLCFTEEILVSRIVSPTKPVDVFFKLTKEEEEIDVKPFLENLDGDIKEICQHLLNQK